MNWVSCDEEGEATGSAHPELLEDGTVGVHKGLPWRAPAKGVDQTPVFKFYLTTS